MTDFLLAAGEKMHLIAASVNKVIASDPAVDAEFPAPGLYDGLPSVTTRHGSIAAESSHDADLSHAAGDFELWDGTSPDKPTGWTLEGSTTVTKETSNPITGSASVRVAGQIYRDFRVPSGAPVPIGALMAEFSGSASNAKVQVFCVETGEWYGPTGARFATETTLWTESTEYAASGWDQQKTKGIVITAPTFAEVESDLVTLRVRLMCGSEGGSDEGIFDSLYVGVSPNLMTVHGHNVPKKHDVQLLTSPLADFSADVRLVGRLEADAFTARGARGVGIRHQPSFYCRLKDNTPVFRASRLQAGSGLSVSGNSKMLTVSGWVRRDGSDSAVMRIFGVYASSEATQRAVVELSAINGIALRCRNSSNTEIVNIPSTAEVIPPDTNMHHFFFSVDTTNDGGMVTRAECWVDGVDVTGTPTITLDGDINFLAMTIAVIGGTPATSQLYGALNEIWFAPGVSLDGSSDLTKFRSATGDRVDLGSDGSTPTASAPWFYHYGNDTDPVTSFATNRGTGGGNFVVNGTIGSEVMFGTSRYWRLLVTTSAPSPADLPPAAIELGQWVLTRAAVLPRQRIVPHPSPRSRPFLEQRSPEGDIFRAATSRADMQSFAFAFRHELADRAEWLEHRDRSGGGTRAVVIVPDANDVGVHLGYLSVEFREDTDILDQFPVTMDFEELPFPFDYGAT